MAPRYKDDPYFLYEEEEGFTCQFIGTQKPTSTRELHDGSGTMAKCPEASSSEGGVGGVALHDFKKEIGMAAASTEREKEAP